MAQLKFNSILVVCTGNICRSPIGERLLRKRLPGVKVKSAGVHGLVKHPADATAADVAANHGVSLEGHAGRKLTAEMARNYDLISGNGVGTYCSGYRNRSRRSAGRQCCLGNGWNRKRSRIPIVKVRTHLNMSTVCWSAPVRNGRSASAGNLSL
ncbi:phosphotyrosine-protein phosphatase [Escherichia coli]|uniref:protein-tyrosine-phosphatase n=1 Tax=Escherichia coli TaxID=562 RepID=A0A2X3JZN4_ECOLX|nr:phosphotyrosine-protein phosphatase [Escherichia coli]